ncbi:uncharacterized protein LOC126741862 [Anthonomus grandis grandis]|uniref:uncharacterized protein LOC126741862 n=1 Tax=Anthonomus grandis grandis TaxID=2921223 RepID=UPI00216519D3|nr:uncharacterized protein LOC126741862 [Anthonomus grandis grandis]
MENGCPYSTSIAIKNGNCSQERACILCGRVIDLLVLFYCPQNHPYCENCYIKFTSKKENETIFSCLVCRYDPKNKPSNSSKQHIAFKRNYHNINNLPVSEQNLIDYQNDLHICSTAHKVISDLKNEDEERFKRLIGLSKKHFYQSDLTFEPREKYHNVKYKLTLPSTVMISRKPIRCPHKMCNKPVALSQFVSHFKCEHKDVPNFGVERGEPFRLSLDVSLIEYDNPFCMAMMNVYEINRVNYLRNPEKTDKAIINTCNKFCQTVPISTFWLLMAGSEKGNSSYGEFWLYTNSEEVHRCTLELSSSEDTFSLTSFCQVCNAINENFLDIQGRMHRLMVAKESLVAMLKEAPVLNLGVTVH